MRLQSSERFLLHAVHVLCILCSMQVDTLPPSTFVWTKVGVEAGENLEDILDRKERERIANKGTFLWGIGNNVGASLRVLASRCAPEILFSPIRSAPRGCDSDPETVFRWTRAETLDGLPFSLPLGTVVTSRGYPRKRFHYAIVCFSSEPLRFETVGRIYAGSLRNLVSGRRIGGSQVTCVVERDTTQDIGREYRVAMRLNTVFPHFVRLSAPVSAEHLATPCHCQCSDDWTLLDWNNGR